MSPFSSRLCGVIVGTGDEAILASLIAGGALESPVAFVLASMTAAAAAKMDGGK